MAIKLTVKRTKRAETADAAYKRIQAKVGRLDMAHYAELLEELLGRQG